MNGENFVIGFHLIKDDETVSIFINDRLFAFGVNEKTICFESHYGESIDLDFQSDFEAQRAYDFIHDCIRNETKISLGGVYNFEESYVEE